MKSKGGRLDFLLESKAGILALHKFLGDTGPLITKWSTFWR